VLYTRIAPDRARPYGHKVPEGADVLNVIFGCTLMSDLLLDVHFVSDLLSVVLDVQLVRALPNVIFGCTNCSDLPNVIFGFTNCSDLPNVIFGCTHCSDLLNVILDLWRYFFFQQVARTNGLSPPPHL
jgi:hypothetical protein